MANQTHEDFSREERAKPGSERSFGLVMAAAFALLAGFNSWHSGAAWPWLAGIAVLFAATAVIVPVLLRPLNWLWFRFGLLLHAIISPVVMGALFFLTVTPIGLLMRLCGKDPLRLKRDPTAATYWIKRDPPGPRAESLKDQF